VTARSLRAALAVLLRENQQHPAALSADAERTIHRRLRLRWAGRIGALVVVGSLGTAAVAGAQGGTESADDATPTPSPTPNIGVAAVTFPVEGGPEFVSAAADLRCGDPVPEPHTTEHDVSLALAQTVAWHEGDAIEFPDSLPSIKAFLSQAPDTDMGALATSGISLIVARDGVVVGIMRYSPADVGWNSVGSGSDSQDFYATQLAAPWISCPGVDGNDAYSPTSSDLAQGTYDVMAIARVFSTPESVALHQTLPGPQSGWGFDTDNLDPNAVYLPGSWDCAQAVAGGQPPRACLPDYTNAAAYDPATSEVTVLYYPSSVVEEFSEVLVSQPLAIAIPGADALPPRWTGTGTELAVFDSIDDFTCGASAGGNALWQGPRQGIFTSLSAASAGPLTDAGQSPALVLAGDVPDDSRVDLVEGARIVYLEDSTLTDPDSGLNSFVQTVVGWSPVSAAAPFTTDRFAGPQTVSLTSEPMNACPGVDPDTATYTWSRTLVGTWRVVAPDGTVTSVDVGGPLTYWGTGG